MSNGYLIGCFAKVQEIRSISYYPVFLQSVVDLIAVGISCTAYGCLTIYSLKDDSDIVLATSNLPIWLSKCLCICVFLFTLVNKYTTPFTMLAVAIERYYRVCKPFDVNSQRFEKVEKIITIIITVLPVVFLTPELAFIIYQSVPFQHGIWDGLNRSSCEFGLLEINRRIRWIVNSVIFFFIPATACFVLYIKVVIELRKMLTQVERNRELTILFMISCFAWIVCWLPEGVGNLVLPPTDPDFNEKVAFWIFRQFYSNLTLLFSAVQPILLILSYRPIKEPIAVLFSKIYTLFRRKPNGPPVSGK